MGEICLNNRFKSVLELICSRLAQKDPDFIILNIAISKFHDFWIFEPVEPRIYSFYYTKNAAKNTRKYRGILEHIIFVNLGINHFELFESLRTVFLFWVSPFLSFFVKAGTGNYEDPRKMFFGILDVNFRSIKKHEIEIW